jgi:dihydroxy-acid dehydratase
MQHINANRQVQAIATLISDGRYSGVSYGAAIGHMTPESYRGGGLLYLQQGDLILLRFRSKRLELLDPTEFANGNIVLYQGDLAADRADLGAERKAVMKKRQRLIAASNRFVGCTDASEGVVPLAVKEDAEIPFVRTKQNLVTL